MFYQNKSKEELIKELQELQQIHNSLKESIKANSFENKQMDVVLVSDQEKFQLLFDKAPLGYQSLDFNGNLIEVNQQWLDTLGYEREEVIGKWFGDFLTPAFQNGFRKRFPLFKERGKIHSEFEMVHKNGSVLFIAFDGRIGYDLNGIFKQTHCILQDITERKQADEALRKSEENLSITLNSIGDGVISTDQNGLVQTMNPVAEKLCGWKITEAKGKPLTEVFKIINSETRQTHTNPVKKVLESGEIVGLANHTSLISKDGTEYQISDSAAPIKNKIGEISGVVLVFSDISEKYLAQKQLLESEKYLKETQIIAQLGSYTLDIKTGFWTSSEILDEIFGIDKNHDKSVQGWVSIIHPDWQKEMNDYFIQDVIGNKMKFDKEYQIIRKCDNEVRWVHGLGKLVYDDQFNPIQMLGTIQDITNRKRIEKELIRSEKELKKVQQITHIGSWYLNVETNEVVWTEELYKMYGFNSTLPPPPYTEHQKLFTPESWETLSISLAKTRETGIPYELQLKTIREDGKNGWMWVRGETVLDKEGKTVGLWGAAQDITERKYTEEKLLLIQKAVESSTNAIGISDAQGHHIFQNKALSDLFGYESAEELDAVGGESKIVNDPIVAREMFDCILNGKSWAGELDMITKSGHVFPAYEYADAIKDTKGNIIGLIGVISDLTERKLAEDKLHESELTYKMLFNSINDAVFISELTNDGKISKFIRVNKVACERLGYTEHELLTKTSFEINSDRAKALLPKLIHGILEKKHGIIETEHITKDGKVIPVEISTNITQIKNKTVFHSIARDITERKHNQEEIEKQLIELKEWHDLSIDREERVVELKHEVNSLLKSIGKQAKYETE